MSVGAIEAVLLDMGGVVLHMANARGLPLARLDWRGRQAMLHRIRAAGGRAELDLLEDLVFGPWSRAYERRQKRGREASWTPFLNRLRERAGIRLTDLDLLEAWFKPYGEQLTPTAGAVPALENLRAEGLRLALVSNVPLPGDLYLGVLRQHGIERPLERCLFSYDRGTRKPSPALLRLALEALEVDAAAAVMVGDRRDRDVAAGRAAGTRTVWIRSDDDGGPDADAVLGSVGELPALLGEWQG